MRYQERLKFLLMTTRPAFFIMAAGMILVGAISINGFAPGVVALAFFYSAAICFVGFGINDYFDREIDRENQSEGIFKGYVVRREWQEKSVIYGSIFFSLLCLISLPLTGRLAQISVVSLIILAVMYSAPPIRLKSTPLFDSATNGLALFFLFALGVGLAGGSFSAINVRAFWAGLIFMPMHALASCPDIEGDRKNGVKTAGTLIGWRGSTVWLAIITALSLISVNWRPVPALGHIGTIGAALILTVKPSEENFYKIIYLGFLIGLPIGLFWLATITGII